METSLLEQELAPLNAQIEQVKKNLTQLEDELRAVEAELGKFSAARQRIDALRELCNAFDKLDELKAGELFWKGVPGSEEAAGHLKRARDRIAGFEKRIQGFLEIEASVQDQIKQQNDELEILYDDVNEAYERDELRKGEFVLEREISSVPYREMVMPWTKQVESERRIRRSVLLALLLCFLLGVLIPMINVPIPDPQIEPVVIPERLAMLVKNMPTAPARPKTLPKTTEEDIQKPKDKTKPKKEEGTKKEISPKGGGKKKGGGGGPKKKPDRVAGGGSGGKHGARQRAESVGVLAFKNTFKDLMVETKVAKLGIQAHLSSKASPRVAGQAIPQRSLVAMQANAGTSGGISNARVTRNVGRGNRNIVGGSGIGMGGGYGNGTGTGYGDGTGPGSGYGRVKSNIVGSGEGDPRPLSDGPGPGRTDEEIQIVFDRYKAALYRIYNKELRKNPTLRGKMLLKISIEGGGEVSLCRVESTDLQSPKLVEQIVARIKRFNFGPKEGVARITIFYPIDFLPAG